jgi:mutator protein MutT
MQERGVAGSRGSCHQCLVRAKELWFSGPMFSAVGIFFDATKRVLSIGRRHDHNDLGFPGGKLEHGETPEDALRREVREEVGVEITKFVEIFDAPAEIDETWTTDEAFAHREAPLTRVFFVMDWMGEPRAVEGLPVKWVAPDRMLETRNSYHGFNRLAFQAAYVPFTRTNE